LYLLGPEVVWLYFNNQKQAARRTGTQIFVFPMKKYHRNVLPIFHLAMFMLNGYIRHSISWRGGYSTFLSQAIEMNQAMKNQAMRFLSDVLLVSKISGKICSNQYTVRHKKEREI
jgi:hypothetical protein